MNEGTAALSYAIRPRAVAKYLGQLAVMLAILTLVPLAAAFLSGEPALALHHVVVIVALVVLAAPTLRVPAPAHLQVNEALTVVALAFVMAALSMTYPMMGAGLPLADALFESVSAITTTGLTTLPGVEDKPRTFLFARAWVQWYGGLGIAVLSVALLMGHHIAARRLTDASREESLVTTARTYARHILVVYAGLTALGIVLVWLLVEDGFVALTHVLAAVSTGGFSVFNDNLAAIDNWPARFAIVSLACLGAVPLALHYQLYRRRWREFVGDLELRALLLAALVLAVVLMLLIHAHGTVSWPEAASHALLMGVSAQTTAGFSSLSVAELDDGSKLVLIAAMFIGGGVGSTAGGVKILRLLVLLRFVQLAIRRTTMPSHAVASPRLGGRPLEHEDFERVMLVITLFAAVVFLSWLAFVVYGHAPLDALFEVVSATGTVGLSTGIAGQELDPVLKGILCADMLLGRVEIVALLVVMYPRNWIGKRTDSR